MSLSHITISSEYDAKSTGSSASHVSLSDSEAVIVAVPAIAPEIVPETTIDDSSSDDACETAGPVAVHATPAPLQIVYAPPASPAGLLSLFDLDKRSFSVAHTVYTLTRYICF
ncbi:hypothetical protein Tco_0650967 [Tanacetum coccineum]